MILRQIEVLILGRFDSEGLEESYGKLDADWGRNDCQPQTDLCRPRMEISNLAIVFGATTVWMLTMWFWRVTSFRSGNCGNVCGSVDSGVWDIYGRSILLVILVVSVVMVMKMLLSPVWCDCRRRIDLT